MKKIWQYLAGTVRCFYWDSEQDIRTYRPTRGWSSEAHLIEIHPITGKQLSDSEWWIFETKL